MTLFGQAALTARRLVEAGGRFVTVFWDEYGLAGTGWDTHWDHFPRMKDELLPGPRPDALRPADRPRPPRAARRDAGRLPERARPDAEAQHRPAAAAATTGRGATRCVLAGGGDRPRPGRRPVRQDRQRPRRAPGLAQGHPGDDLPPAGHRPRHDPHRPPGPAHAARSPRARSSPKCPGLRFVDNSTQP